MKLLFVQKIVVRVMVLRSFEVKKIEQQHLLIDLLAESLEPILLQRKPKKCSSKQMMKSMKNQASFWTNMKLQKQLSDLHSPVNLLMVFVHHVMVGILLPRNELVLVSQLELWLHKVLENQERSLP